MADRIAVGLSRLGVGRNDVVALQLPNWWQFTLTYLACSRIGAVLNPLMHIFRERELSFMLKHGEAKAVDRAQGVPRASTMNRWLRGAEARPARAARTSWSSAARAQQLRRAAGRPGLGKRARRQGHPDRATGPGPDDITQLIYTSGTTGEPKGVHAFGQHR